MRTARFLIVGAGGLGSNQARIFIQMGAGQIDLVDPDLVEPSNLNRQFFTVEDLARPKSHQVLKNLRPYATGPTLLRGYFMPFENWYGGARRPQYSVVCCGVDSQATMIAVARYGFRSQTPVVFTNVSSDGESFRIFTQRPGDQACFACYLPQALEAPPDRDHCIPVPGIADVLQAAIGFGTRATVAEVMNSPMGNYNCRDITFGGIDVSKTVERRADCPICGRAA